MAANTAAMKITAGALQALAAGENAMIILDRLAALRNRVRDENREDVTDDDVDFWRRHIGDRQKRIDAKVGGAPGS